MALKINGSINEKAGFKTFDEYLNTRSYVEGYTPSQSDVVIYQVIKTVPKEFVNVTRWFNHIKSFTSEFEKLAGVKKALSDYGITEAGKAAPAKAAAAEEDVDDLFASDDEADEAAEKLKQERIKAYTERKSKKPGVIAKSNVILDIKPWDDETDMKAMEDKVRTIEMDGLVWGVSKLMPVAFNIKKLQIVCVVEDEKVSIDELSEKISDFEDYVQSVDIAAFQKI